MTAPPTTCGTCGFFAPQRAGAAQGTCHRYPPTAILVPKRNVLAASGEVEAVPAGIFPVVNAGQGCGEWRPNEATARQMLTAQRASEEQPASPEGCE